MFRTSWFSQKAPADSQANERQGRPSDAGYSAGRPSTLANDDASLPPGPGDLYPRSKQTPATTHTTPHDAIIAQLQSAEGAVASLSPTKNQGEGRMQDTGEDGQRSSPDTPTLSPAASHSRLEIALSPAPSLYTGVTTANVRYTGNQPSGSVQTTTVDVLLDPFDGSSHGVLLPQELNIGPEDEVLDLQSQIAKMHMDMEGVGPGGDGRKKTKGKHGMASRTGIGDDRRMYHAVPSLRARAMSTSTIGTIADEKEVDEEGVGVTDEETEKSRAREEEFAKLANQFEGKKESIRDMMNKLDDLSKALTEFHALQASDVVSTRPDPISPAPPSPPITAASPIAGGPRQSVNPPIPQSSGKLPDNMLWAAPKPLQASASGESSFLPKSLSRLPSNGLLIDKGPKPKKPTIPTLIVNSDKQQHLIESPASTLGSLPSLHADD